MSWFVFGNADGRDPKDLVGSLALVEVGQGTKERALAFVQVHTYVPATTLYGLPQPAKAIGSVKSFVPETKGAAVPLETQLDVYPGQELAVLPKDAKTRLRHIDRRGVPWQIEGYVTPPEGFSKPVVAWTSHYFGSDGASVEGDTLDDVQEQIKAIYSSNPRNPVPTFDASTALRDDEGPQVVKDEAGDYQLHGVDLGGKYTIWAVRSSAFQSDVVGPASTVQQARADVAAYRQGTARASSASSFVESFGGRALGPLDTRGATGLSIPDAEPQAAQKPTSTLWIAALAFGGAGLLLWLTTSQDKRGLY